MKLLDVAWKDLWRSFRNAFFLAFGLGVPILATGIFYLAFGGLASGEGDFSLPTTRVQVVNLDQADPQYGGFSIGQSLVDILGSGPLGERFDVTAQSDAAAARRAVDNQDAGVAVIIPEDLTRAAFGGGQATIVLYQDPTLTFGPSIVKGIVRGFVDGFAGSQIAVTVATEMLGESDLTLGEGQRMQMAMEYGDWARSLGEGYQGEDSPLLEVRSPADAEEGPNEGIARIIGLIMAGMMVFYVFFSGAASAMNILQEEEAGTLPRLFTTPTRQSTILGGKYLSILALLVVQLTALLAFSGLVFGIDWGGLLPLVLVTGALVAEATGFGIFVTSLLRNTRQTGIVYGGVMTVTGMLAMSGIFTAGVPGASRTFEIVALFMPQGWGVQGYRLLLQGAGPAEVLLAAAVMAGLSVVFFVIGVWRFSRRFA